MSVVVSKLDFLFTCVSLLCLLGDIVLDVCAVVTFYQAEDYVCVGLLLLFLLGSSVLVQVFSWLWYCYDGFRTQTKAESCLSRPCLKLLHVVQLGSYVRFAGVVESSLLYFNKKDPQGYASYPNHDLSLLRLIETFSEGAPQFVLMLTLLLQRFQLDPVKVLKSIASASAIACSVTIYHRSLRFFLPDKRKQSFLSSVVYFLWNLCLLASRLTSLALFASVLPCFVFVHFFCSWLVLFFFAWRSKTDLMDSPGGEWLYRATVGLIWYFDWFNVSEGKTRNRTILYHGYILADVSLLCGLWYWAMNTDPPYVEIPHLVSVIIALSVVGVYIIGLLCKVIYYKCYHPNLSKGDLKGSESQQEPERSTEHPRGEDQVMFRTGIYNMDVVDSPEPSPATEHYNKRMRRLAGNFYS
ncbi:XK-related protein 8-like [Betta splendens]|uniref:XK-related protein n=1 Tax=Betta splendens TaxID=158456 RepID=A0A6P7NQ35_BETSP|nr:XK-related protein 8-like [Betta splendens]